MMGLSILGATGTIGDNTIEIVERFPDKFNIVSLSAGRNIEKLIPLIEKFQPTFVCVQRELDVEKIEKRFPGLSVGWGEEGLSDCVRATGVQTVVMGIVGFAAMSPTLEAVKQGHRVALANKESLVVGGTLLREMIDRSQAEVIPVDSEHNALYQLMEGRRPEEVQTLILTASGGPLLKRPELPLNEVTPEIAVAHPNWKMGPKISVDSATMMNKGLELIEAHYLFSVPEERLGVWVHPQSVVHGALCLKDNSYLAQLSRPDMKASIGHALSYPDRLPEVVKPLDFKVMASLEFFEPDLLRFPCLALAQEALRSGGSFPIVLNAANEIAVEAFLAGQIKFPEIAKLVEKSLERHRDVPISALSDVFALDEQARGNATQLLKDHF